MLSHPEHPHKTLFIRSCWHLYLNSLHGIVFSPCQVVSQNCPLDPSKQADQERAGET